MYIFVQAWNTIFYYGLSYKYKLKLIVYRMDLIVWLLHHYFVQDNGNIGLNDVASLRVEQDGPKVEVIL